MMGDEGPFCLHMTEIGYASNPPGHHHHHPHHHHHHHHYHHHHSHSSASKTETKRKHKKTHLILQTNHDRLPPPPRLQPRIKPKQHILHRRYLTQQRHLMPKHQLHALLALLPPIFQRRIPQIKEPDPRLQALDNALLLTPKPLGRQIRRVTRNRVPCFLGKVPGGAVVRPRDGL